MNNTTVSAPTLAGVAALALAYFALGMAGLLLAIAPGYASAVFPAAGVALAALLHGGNRLWPGVWLGSFGINLWVAWSHAGQIAPKAVAIAAAIALGASLQAWVAASLVRRCKYCFGLLLDDERCVMRFLLLGGPIGCLVSASVGVGTLLVAGIVTSTEFSYNWWNWWVGDTLGTMLATPLALIVLNRREPLWRARMRTVALPMLVIAAAVVAVFVRTSQWEQNSLLSRVKEDGQVLSDLLRNQITAHDEVVSSLKRFVGINPTLSYAEFERFSQGALAEHGDIRVLAWDPRVTLAERPALEARMGRIEGYGDFRITDLPADGEFVPAATRAEYVAIGYVVPLAGSERILGYDVLSEPVRHAALRSACESGQPTATAPLRLVQDTSRDVGFLIFAPVFDESHGQGTAAERCRNLLGYAVAAFKVRQMVETAIGGRLKEGMVFWLDDPAAEEGNRALYRSDGGAAPRHPTLSWQAEFQVGARPWRLTVFPTPQYLAANRPMQAWGVLAVGMLLVSFLQALLLAMTGRASAIQRRVEEQTGVIRQREQALRDSEARYRHLIEGIHAIAWEADPRTFDFTYVSPEAERISGYSAEQWKAPGFWADHLHPDEKDRCVGFCLEATRECRDHDFEYRLRRADGSYVWLRDMVTVGAGPDGPATLCGVMIDITERKRGEEALSESEQRFRTMADSAPVLIWISGLDKGCTYFNKPWLDFTGRTLEKELGNGWADGVHPDDLPRCLEIYVSYFDARESFGMEYRLRRRDGQYRWIMDQGVPRYDPDGQFLGYIGSCIDITARKYMEQALRQSEYRVRTILEAEPECIKLSDAGGRLLLMNPAGLEMIEASDAPERVLGAPVANLVAPQYRQAFNELNDRVLRGERGTLEFEIVGLKGTRRWMETHAVPLRESDDSVSVLAVTRDISERVRATEHMRLAAAVFANTADAIVVTDALNRIMSINPAFTEITGYAPEEVLGKNPGMLKSKQQDAAFYREMWRALTEEGRWQGEIWNRRKSGESYPEWLRINTIRDDAGHVTHHVGVFTDISERKEAEQRIHYLAHHDPLTGLPNRMLLLDRLEQALLSAERNHTHAAVFFFDLDRFKAINDSLGHAAGDDLLCAVAQRAQGCVRAMDTVARLGGDEFVVVLTEVADLDGVARVAQGILDELRQPLSLAGRMLHVTSSIGISLYPQDGEDGETLMKNADTAMYQAKLAGRNAYHFFSAGLDNAMHERLALESEMRLGIERGEFELHFQPQVASGADHRIIGVEALLRWRHPTRGLLLPEAFLPIAEDMRLIVPLGGRILRMACHQCSLWHAQGLPLRVAVNLSAWQFRQEDLAEAVRSALEAAALAPDFLELEITESVLLEPDAQVMRTLQALQSLGVRIAVDNFGIGYSSMNYLKRFPLHRLKIDKSFVDDIASNPTDRAITEAVIALARAMQLEVIAEGVETQEQAGILAKLGCDEMQGHCFGHPVPAEAFFEQAVARA